ncbi:MAG TPA: hypothetical protein VNM14_02265 [Planctomycetota bacterium]|jgi:hypothetical protein|nr:hypothetical protein [Planctomycetota bacterium]
MITFAISGHRRELRTTVHATLLVLWALAGAAFLATWTGSPLHPPLARFACWCFVGAAIAWNAGRRGAGRETLTVTPRQLVLRRSVGPFRVRRRYDLGRVRSPRLAAPRRRRFRIEFDYDGRTRRFGRNLSAHEAACAVGIIRRASRPARRPL